MEVLCVLYHADDAARRAVCCVIERTLVTLIDFGRSLGFDRLALQRRFGCGVLDLLLRGFELR